MKALGVCGSTTIDVVGARSNRSTAKSKRNVLAYCGEALASFWNRASNRFRRFCRHCLYHREILRNFAISIPERLQARGRMRERCRFSKRDLSRNAPAKATSCRYSGERKIKKPKSFSSEPWLPCARSRCAGHAQG